MSVQKRLEKYWRNDARVGMQITKEIGLKNIVEMSCSQIDKAFKQHRFNGKMQRYKKKYDRLNRKHVGRFLIRIAKKIDKNIKEYNALK